MRQALPTRVGMRPLILFFVLGAAWLQTRAALPDLQWAWLLLPLLAGVTLLPSEGTGRGLRWGVALVLAAGLGYFYAAWRAEARLAEQLPVAWEGRDLQLHGRVTGLPEVTPRGVRFGFTLAPVSGGMANRPRSLLLNVYVKEGETPPQIRGGDCLRLTARLQRPHGSLNPGGFDYEAWLLERGIRATGHVIGLPVSATACGMAWRAGLDNVREALRSRLQAALTNAEHGGILVALAVGDQNAIPDSQWTLFRSTGVTHLMSISGLHVTLFSSLVFFLVQWAWRRVPRLVRQMPARPVAAVLGFLGAAAYVALAGFGIPAQRTLYMLAAVAVALAAGRLHSPSQVLATALAVVVLIDPWAALSPGFWLSFGAVAALFYTGAGRLGQPSVWSGWLRTQWAVSLALLPALLLLFHEVSLVSPIANAFAIPLVSLLAVPLVLVGVMLPWDFVIQLAHGVIQLTLVGLHWLAALPQPVFHAATPTWPALLLALAGVVVMLLPRGLPGRWLGVLLMLPLLFPRLEKPATGEVWLTVLDVGQGLAVLVRTTEHALLYDTGPRYASGEDAGQRVVAPYLHAQGLGRLDALVVSHDDSDHAGGSVVLVDSHRPGWVLTSVAGQRQPPPSDIGQALLAAAPHARACQAGQSWQWDGVRFEVLYPPWRHYANPNFSDNDRSCVIRIEARGGTLLLTGDIARLAELSLLEGYPASHLQSDLMVVPHHGSASSSMPALLAAVSPKLALVSVGLRNAYGHPAPEVLARYRQAGAQVLRTDRNGALDLKLGSGPPRISLAREASKRYWHGR